METSLDALVEWLRSLRPIPARRLRFRSFVQIWVEQVPQAQRKTLSHFGALPCRDELDPVHYTVEGSGATYFDPTNYIYRLALLYVTATAEDSTLASWLSEESAGDVMESLLGLAFCKQRQHVKDEVARKQLELATWLEHVAYFVYRISRTSAGKLQAVLCE